MKIEVWFFWGMEMELGSEERARVEVGDWV